MTSWQRRLHLWTWPLAALAILACAILALDARHRVAIATSAFDASEAR